MTQTLDTPSEMNRSSTTTPKDYHRIHFDTSTLPSKRIVGLLACQRKLCMKSEEDFLTPIPGDPLLRRLRSKVVSSKIASIAAPPPAKGKEKEKKKKAITDTITTGASTSAPNVNGGNQTPGKPLGKLWEVELEDTVIFPEGGGQPFDTGSISIDDNGTRRNFRVEGCLRRKLDSIHLVRVPEEDNGLFENVEGREAEVDVDWERRVDHVSSIMRSQSDTGLKDFD